MAEPLQFYGELVAYSGNGIFMPAPGNDSSLGHPESDCSAADHVELLAEHFANQPGFDSYHLAWSVKPSLGKGVFCQPQNGRDGLYNEQLYHIPLKLVVGFEAQFIDDVDAVSDRIEIWLSRSHSAETAYDVIAESCEEQGALETDQQRKELESYKGVIETIPLVTVPIAVANFEYSELHDHAGELNNHQMAALELKIRDFFKSP